MVEVDVPKQCQSDWLALGVQLVLKPVLWDAPLEPANKLHVFVFRAPVQHEIVWTELLVHSLDEVHFECCQVCIGNVLRRFDQVSIFGAFKQTVVSGLQARTRFEGCLDVAIWIKAEFVKSLRTWSWGVIAAFYSVHKTQLGRGQFKLWLLFPFAFAVLRLRFGQVWLENTRGWRLDRDRIVLVIINLGSLFAILLYFCVLRRFFRNWAHKLALGSCPNNFIDFFVVLHVESKSTRESNFEDSFSGSRISRHKFWETLL